MLLEMDGLAWIGWVSPGASRFRPPSGAFYLVILVFFPFRSSNGFGASGTQVFLVLELLWGLNSAIKPGQLSH